MSAQNCSFVLCNRLCFKNAKNLLQRLLFILSTLRKEWENILRRIYKGNNPTIHNVLRNFLLYLRSVLNRLLPKKAISQEWNQWFSRFRQKSIRFRTKNTVRRIRGSKPQFIRSRHKFHIRNSYACIDHHHGMVFLLAICDSIYEKKANIVGRSSGL